MPCHEFGIIDNFSGYLKKYLKYQPEKYNCISVDDDYFTEEISEKFSHVEMINPCLNKICYNLCYYGITIIPEKSLEAFRDVLINENTDVFNELILLTTKAISENKNIIHYGI